MTTHRSAFRTLTLIVVAIIATAGFEAQGGTPPPEPATSLTLRVTPTTTASCYGPGFYGRTTADGTRFTEASILVAHRTLPLGTPRRPVTRVAVAANGRRVVTWVRDRGPYTRAPSGAYARTWDVSNGLARALGYRDCYAFGVRSVRVTVLD